MKLITIPLRDFAVPSPRCGSLESRSGFAQQAAEGREIHLRVQKGRKADPSYQAEVAVAATFQREGYLFRVEGRMDGIFRRDPPHIEEIKSTFDLGGLARRLAEDRFTHPYSLQLHTYGYLHFLEHGVLPSLSFHLVSTRSGESRDLQVDPDTALYEAWLELRLQELAAEARQGEKRASRRRKMGAGLVFPFERPRPGQMELARAIDEATADGTPLMVQAPTGLGKTVGVLYPVLKDALGRGQRTVYVTPKNSQHRVAEDAVERFRQAGSRLKALSITAKSKICFMEEPLCTPEQCEHARDYHTKVREHGIRDILGKKRSLRSRTFRELGERHAVCPFELQFEIAAEADVIICDYNYVFAPRSALSPTTAMPIDQDGKPNLVIDEAHNLPARAMEYYSPALSSAVLERMREEMKKLRLPFSRQGGEALDRCLKVLASCGGGGGKPRLVEPPVEKFVDADGRIRRLLSLYLESTAEILPDDPVLRLAFYWGEFTAALEHLLDPGRDGFFATWSPLSSGGTLKITCCDAGPMLAERYPEYGKVVAFSATLKPFEYYARLSGLDPGTIRTAEFSSPFPRLNRKLMVIPQVSTRYSERGRNYSRIAEAVARIAAIRRGNYFVFLPSFDFLDSVAAVFAAPEGFGVLRQERGMRNSQIESVLDHLRSADRPTIVFAVQGGSFSEGVDYPGEMAVGAFVVGPPLPTYDLEREQMRDYYERRYGAGFDYAYAVPAMARAVQAAGRVIRSETDRGLIVLMDARFVETTYTRAMPADWFESDVTELVSEAILADVAAFWAETAAETDGSDEGVTAFLQPAAILAEKSPGGGANEYN